MTPTIEIRQSDIHNKGIFASRNIAKGARVIEYVGRKISKAEADEIYNQSLRAWQKDKTNGAVYIFELNNRFDIDGNVPFNDARFINHSCNPNCETEIINNRIWITSTRQIRKGEEITYNYGYSLEDYHEHPCKCGSPNCIGFILDEDLWSELKKH